VLAEEKKRLAALVEQRVRLLQPPESSHETWQTTWLAGGFGSMALFAAAGLGTSVCLAVCPSNQKMARPAGRPLSQPDITGKLDAT
jgi:hypothetical protein